MNKEELINSICYWVSENHKMNKKSMFYGVKDKGISSDTLSDVIATLRLHQFEVHELVRWEKEETSELFISWGK